MKIFFFLFFVSLSLIITGCTQEEKQKEIFSIVDEAAKSYFFIPENQYSGFNIDPYYDSLLETSDVYGKNSIKYEKAKALLYSGRTIEAIEIFREFYDIKKRTYTVVGLSNEEEASIEKMLALSYLRLGEQENCLHHHSSASCIVPIREEGYHQLPFGSSEAIKLYKEILAAMPWDLESKWLLNIAYMTLGEYPENVPKEFLIPDDVFRSEYPLKTFPDIAPHLGLDVNQLSGGSIVDDFNNDGYLDIVVSSWFITHPLKLFINDQKGGFIDASAESGLDQIGGGLNMIQADYDNDGYMDILLLRGAWMDTLGLYPNSLLKNRGDGTFEDVTIEAGLLSFHPTQTATWGDFNNDGWLDLFIGNESSSKDNIHPCELYLNQQDGTFKEVAAMAGVSISTADSFHYVKGVVSGDYDNDGFLDIYISTINSDTPNILLKNTGMDDNNIPRFENVTETAGVSDIFSSFTCWFWDYNNDGLLDLYVPGYGKGLNAGAVTKDIAAEYLGMPHTAVVARLYENLGNGKFKNVAKEVGLEKISYAMGANFGDLDNDGYLDIYLSTGEARFSSIIPNKVYRNAAGKKFQDVTTAGGFGQIQKGHAVSFADLDNDGDQDIHVVLGGAFEGDNFPNSLYLNPYDESKNWISIKLEGTASNRSAIGSKVKIKLGDKATGRFIYREVNSGGSFGSNPLTMHVGLGENSVIDEIEIIWAGSKSTQLLKKVRANQFIKIIEGEDKWQVLNLKKLDFNKSSPPFMDHHH
ncbi:CRTAC1 family protein [Anditalea andensis]|uniref:ASPIC/UnbV domain-containing protein n=1 Tax=Anditalea andensis TaxID=1048983 RepID=A0A074L2R2_9BACT|nr:CRTAC1 family protein [Anditalea andensis]KEO75479.1 hypothetical protein EL17_01110 [Anditalea andensis]